MPLPELPPALAVPYRVLPEKNQPATGLPSLLVEEPSCRRETMQVRKTRAIGVDGEHRAIARTAAIVAVPYRVLPDKINPAFGESRRCWPCRGRETMQVRKTRAIGVDGEHRAIARTAAMTAVPYRVLPDKINPAYG